MPKPRSGIHLPPVSAAQAICFVAVLGTLGWAYEPTLVWFYQTWVRALLNAQVGYPGTYPYNPSEVVSMFVADNDTTSAAYMFYSGYV